MFKRNKREEECKKRKIFAFYDHLISTIVLLPLDILGIVLIILYGAEWHPRFLDPIFAPLYGAVVLMLFPCHWAVHDIESNTLYFRRFGANINKIPLCEIQTVEVVKLTPEKKKTLEWTKKLGFNKYLKIVLKNETVEYAQIAGFSQKQIKRIIKILLSEKDLPAEEE